MPLTEKEQAQLQQFERRRVELTTHQWWERLSMEQKFGVYQLQKFGYELAFIRNQEDGPIAVVKRDAELATVDKNGDVNLTPDLQLRDRRPAPRV
ncbi:MAG: hypothetical protein WEA82_03970 [Idiomarina sp.]